MVQSSLTAWLKKPASVLAPSSQPLRTSPPKAQPASPSLARDAISAYTPALPAEDSVSPQTSHPTNPAPFASSLPPLPPNVELVPLTEDLLPSFKRLNSLMLPMAYPTAFYNETLTDPVIANITLVALWHATPPSTKTFAPTSPQNGEEKQPKPHLIGAIRCRLLPSQTLYISTLSLLPPYRSHGIATHLLHRILITGVEKYGITSIAAHAWESNEEGLEWYAKRGFKEEGREEGYYRRLRPSGAVLVRRGVSVGDLLATCARKY